jgi:DNA-directed RNA polymerase specialized sigma24 family protein
LAELEQRELAQRIRRSLAELKPPLGDILSDFFLHGLRYEEIAKKHGLAVGSVGGLFETWAGGHPPHLGA